jgi:hypothetical protein
MRSPNLRALAFTLVEFLLTVAVAIGIAAVVYRQYSIAEADSRTVKETSSAGDISSAILRTYSGAANFGSLSTSSAINDGLVPKEMIMSDRSGINNRWGGTITLSGVTVSGDPNRGFSLVYTNVPSDACMKFVRIVAQGGQYDTAIVNSTQVLTSRVLDDAAATTACSGNASTIDIRYTRGNPGQGGSTLALCVPPGAVTQSVPCGTGFIGNMTQSRTGTCTSQYSPISWTAWVTTDSSGCVVGCAPDPTSPQSQTLACSTGQSGSISQQRTSYCPSQSGGAVWNAWTTTSNTCCNNSTTANNTQTGVCPTGYVTSSGASSFAQTNSCSTTYACPGNTPTTNCTAFSPSVSSNCAVACVAPAPDTTTYTQAASCPSGQVTSNGTTAFTQSQSCTKTYTCSGPTGTATSNSCPDSTAWAPTVGSMCGTACVASSANMSRTQTVSCQGGQVTSTGATSFTQTQTYTANYTCASSNSTPAETDSNVSAWGPSVSGTCGTACVAPASTTAIYTQQTACPTGTWARGGKSYLPTFPQTQSCTTTYSCPSLNAPAVASTNCPSSAAWTPADGSALCIYGPELNPYGDFSNINAGQWTNTANATIGGGSFACTAGNNGYVFRNSFGENLNAGTTYEAVYTLANYASGNMAVDFGGANGTTHSGNGTYYDRFIPASTSAERGLQCLALGSTVSDFYIRQVYPGGACVAPVSSTSAYSQTATCPSGQVTTSGSSTFTQSQNCTTTYSCPNGSVNPVASTCPAAGAWAPTTMSVCATACVAPATTTKTNTQSANCPTGYTTPGGAGTFTQSQTYTATYSCPTATGAVVETDSNYSGFGPSPAAACTQTAPTCVVPPNSTSTYTQSGTCPSGQVTSSGSNTFTQSQNCTTTYSCPSTNGSPVANNVCPSGAAWAPTSGTVCALQCTPSTQTKTNTQTTACSSGHVTPAGASSFSQSQTYTATFTCATQNSVPTETDSNYSAFTPTEPSACSATLCVPPANTTASYAQNGACPTNRWARGGNSYLPTFPQTQSCTTTYSCPTTTGSPVASTNCPSAGSWTPVDGSAVCVYGPELNPYGDFTDGSKWTNTAGATIGSGQAVCTAASNGYIYRNVSGENLTAGTNYEMAYTLAYYNTGNAMTDIVGIGTGVYHSGNGTYYDQYIPGTTAPERGLMCANLDATIRNFSIRQVFPGGTCYVPYGTVAPFSQTATCTTGYTTTGGSSTFGQNQSCTLTYSCPTTTSSPVATNACPASAAWTPTTAATCQPTCVAPGPITITQSGQGNVAGICSAGTMMADGSRNYAQSLTDTFSCPALTGPYTANIGTWSPASGMACASVFSGSCVLPSPSTKTAVATRTASNFPACPAGQFGSITQNKTQQCDAAAWTSICSSTTTAYKWNVGACSGAGWYDATPYIDVINTCAPGCAAGQGFTWTVGAVTCGRGAGAGAYTGGTVSQNSNNGHVGTATFTCQPNGTFGPANASPAPTCT